MSENSWYLPWDWEKLSRGEIAEQILDGQEYVNACHDEVGKIRGEIWALEQQIGKLRTKLDIKLESIRDAEKDLKQLRTAYKELK
jgi:uncharacterized coiled-coil DUF342 family protein